MSNQERCSMDSEEATADDVSLFLNSIEDRKVKNITKKLIRMDLSDEEKLTKLKPYLNGQQLEQAEEIIRVTGRYFFNDLSSSDQEFAEEFISKNDYRVLDQIVKVYKKETRMSYNMWKQLRMEDKSCATPTAKRSEAARSTERALKRHCSQSITILLLGQTGSGKSTFINSLANYLAYQDFQSVLTGRLHVPIPVTFSLTDCDYVPHRITHEATVKDSNAELHEDGESCTQRSKTFIFKCGSSENLREIRIIDTPGYGDTRGDTKDRENLKNILDAVSAHREIHAIIYLLQPNNSKLSKDFSSCLDDFFQNLHKSAKNNILFCFTNARATGYKPGESTTTLNKYLKNAGNFDIILTKKNQFAFENEPFRYLCAARKKAYLPEPIEVIKESWRQSSQEFKRLLTTISQMTPHRVRDTLSVNRVRKVIEILREPLAKIARLHIANLVSLNEKSLESRKLQEHSEQLETRLKYEVQTLRTEFLDSPVIVCRDLECCRIVHVNGIDEKIHKTVCLEFSEMTLAKGKTPCPNCGHLLRDHKVTEYKVVVAVKTEIDVEVNNKHQETTDSKRKVDLFIEKMERSKNQYERDLELIQKVAADFTVFLKSHSILTYKDMIGEYLEVLIRQLHLAEEGQLEAGANELIASNLRHFKTHYLEQVKKMESPEAKVCTLEELEEKIVQLKKSPLSGQFLRDVQMLEESIQMSSQVKDEVILDLGNDYNKNIFPS